MADQLDNRPVFTIVMGCNGAGKSVWKRANRDRLPERYYDKDSIADGVGGWDTGRAREHTDTIVNQAVAEALAGRHNFGIESTYSGQPGRALVERAVAAGYRIEGVYIGTSSPDINIERIRQPRGAPDRPLRRSAARSGPLPPLAAQPEADGGWLRRAGHRRQLLAGGAGYSRPAYRARARARARRLHGHGSGPLGCDLEGTLRHVDAEPATDRGEGRAWCVPLGRYPDR